MPTPILGTADPDPTIFQRVGKIASEWAWVEMILSEMLAHFCQADHGSMYVITKNVSASTITDWIRTLTKIKVQPDTSQKIILDLLTEVDLARSERNTVVHGVWRAHDTPGFGLVQTFNWDRQEVMRDELWSTSDLDAVIEDLHDIQKRLSGLGLTMGFLTVRE